MYCVATKPTPILNTANFQGVFGAKKLPLDDQGLLRPVEMIALPGTKFQILKKLPHHILEVITEEYPYGPQYIDSRFVTFAKATPSERCKILPDLKTISSRLESSLGLPYIWGGNWGRGIPEIQTLYQPKIPANLKKTWTLSGVDCSGLLFEATNGYTPRNTSDLLQFGEIVPSIQNVKPLDILVWPGHVVIVLTPTLTIESLYGKGVITTPLATRLTELSSTNFIIRRFFPKQT
ncbi:MAG: hypothetical protein K1000chlam3_00922 [Chlamydiae bacterium]|nr:hypothetical protein [Chlamydiota bacterium]